MRRRPELICALVALALLLAAPARPAWAQTPDDAVEKQRTAVYREGVALAEAGRWGEALERFQRVVALRSAPRALLALASAEEHVGRLVSAKRTYGKARDDARAEHDEALAAKAEASLQALDPRIPRLALILPGEIAGAEARLEGAPIEISAGGVEVDPGVYHLAVSASGKVPFEERVVIAAGQKKDVLIAFAPAAPSAPPPALVHPAPTPAPEAGEAPPRARRGPPVGAWILAGAGLAALTAGIIYRVHERSIYDEARAATPIEVDRGNDARSQMIVGTAVAGVGAGAIAGAALWWTFSF